LLTLFTITRLRPQTRSSSFEQRFLLGNLTNQPLRLQPLADVYTHVEVRTTDDGGWQRASALETLEEDDATDSDAVEKKWSTHACGDVVELMER
jgi:hypothetical protein